MKRRNFLRNVVLGIAASLLPKILQPSDFELEPDMEVVYGEGFIPMVGRHGAIVAYYPLDSFEFLHNSPYNKDHA